MKRGIASFMVSRNRFSRLVPRLMFSVFVAIAVIAGLLMHRPALPVAFGENSTPAEQLRLGGGGKLKLLVRDSMTGFALPAEVVSQVKNGVGTLWTNAKGEGDYQLSSGRNELELNAADHKTLRTHFEPDVQSVKNVTFWANPGTIRIRD